MKVDFPELSKRIGLDKMPFIVHVKAVIDCVIFELGYVAGDVENGHFCKCRGAPGAAVLGVAFAGRSTLWKARALNDH
jgi:hypothetical protein